jgi:murein DD-endopeptidase MepM/ murein hydrolase activator NlpD
LKTKDMIKTDSAKTMFRKVFTVFVCFIVAFTFLAYPFSTITSVSASDSTSSSLKSDIASLEEKQKALKNEIADLKSKQSDTQSEKNYTDQLISVTQNKIDLASQLVIKLTSDIDAKQQEIADKQATIDETFEAFRNRMAASYEDGESSYVGILLGSDSLEDLLERSDRVSSMLEYDRDLVTKYRQEKADLQQEEQELEDSKTLQENTVASLQSDKSDYETLSAQSDAYLTQLSSQQTKTQAEYEAAKKEEDDLDAQLTAYLQKLAAQRAAAAAAAAASSSSSSSSSASSASTGTVIGNGSFIWPVPTSYTSISSGYGWRTWSSGYKEFHRGIDIPVPYGTNIYAADSGTVVRAEWNNSYGYYVLIDHGNGLATLYGHNSSLVVSAGQTVTQGQVIAHAGATGNATGNHCHFEVRVNGSITNPLAYL